MSISVRALGGLSGRERRNFIRRFISYPKGLYSGDPYWIPWFDADMGEILERRHPFFLSGDAEFFLALDGEEPAGRIMALDIPAYRKEHGTEGAFFYFFDFAEGGLDAARSLLEAAASWARERGLRTMEGPFLFGGASGSGLLIEGFDSPPPMTMMLYNRPHYAGIYAALGMEKKYDLLSFRLDPESFVLSDRITRAAELVRKRSGLSVLRFQKKRDMRAFADQVASLYNLTIADHPEDYPLSDAELARVKKDLLFISLPSLIKVLADGEKAVGYLFAFPDLGPQMRRAKGRPGLLAIAGLLAAMKKPKRLLMNGMGLLKEYRGRGGNALLYAELTDTVLKSGAVDAELVQINEGTELMLKDLETLGAKLVKRYRVYLKAL